MREFTLGDTLVEMDWLGQKSGIGFYKYDTETRGRIPDPDLDDIIAVVAEQWQVQRREIGAEEIVDRLVLALINEGAAIVREGVAARPSDVDVVYINGYGFPRWRGGPLFYADSLGLEKVIRKLELLREQTGDEFWEPDALLRTLHDEKRTLGELN